MEPGRPGALLCGVTWKPAIAQFIFPSVNWGSWECSGHWEREAWVWADPWQVVSKQGTYSGHSPLVTVGFEGGVGLMPRQGPVIGLVEHCANGGVQWRVQTGAWPVGQGPPGQNWAWPTSFCHKLILSPK